MIPSLSTALAIDLDKANALLGEASSGKVKAISLFGGPSNMTGVVMESNGSQGIAWITPDGESFLIGMFFDKKGQNYSKDAHQQYIEKSSVGNKASLVLEDLANLEGVYISGSENSEKNKTLYVFADLNCSYCKDFYRVINENIAEVNHRGVAIKWIPVAILGDKSMAQAVSLLAEDKALQAELIKDHYGVGGSILPASTHNSAFADYKTKIEKSNKLFQSMGDGTPLLVYSNEGVEIKKGSLSKDEFIKLMDAIK